MNITRQIALVAVPPLAATVAAGALGASLGTQNSLLAGAATVALLGLAAGASYVFARPLLAGSFLI